MIVGYIGLGLMGKSIARNILAAGFEVVVYNRSLAPVEELAAAGARTAANPAEVARQVDLVMTCLPDSPDVESVALGEQGIVAGAHPGLIYVDNSTIKPSTARFIAERLTPLGVSCLDAPVSGGDVGARDATLAIMVGGPAAALERARPGLQSMGKTITHVGDAGADPRKVVEAIRGGAAQCWTLDVKAPRLFAGNRQPGFRGRMQAKDLGIVLDTARQYGMPLPSTSVNAQLFGAMREMGLGELDNSAVIAVLEALAGTRFA